MNDAAPQLVQAHILHLDGTDAGTDRIVRDGGGVRIIIAFVPAPAATAAAAVDLVENHGVQLIELDGGLGPSVAADVLEATGHRVPVGLVMFGAESLGGAADYGARYDHRPDETSPA